jgi:hypothetical protein
MRDPRNTNREVASALIRAQASRQGRSTASKEALDRRKQPPFLEPGLLLAPQIGMEPIAMTRAIHRRISRNARELFAALQEAEPYSDQWKTYKSALHAELDLPIWTRHTVLSPEQMPDPQPGSEEEAARQRYDILSGG